MPMPSRTRARVTLTGATVLHAFTHAFPTMFAPLYLMMVADMHLGGVKYATLLITVYGMVYYLVAYPAGVLADRYDRHVLLSIGIIGNAVAVMMVGYTHNYAALLGLAVMAGVFGTIFHPTANSLIPAHFPGNPGFAIGLLGIGSGLGFWFGPLYSGWRARATGSWQQPCIELGAMGVVAGLLFLIFARDAGDRRHRVHKVNHPMGKHLRRQAFTISSIMLWRDFSGNAALTLLAVFLQKAYHRDPQQTGYVIGTMMLFSMVVNPLATYYTAGKRRLPALAMILICGGAVLATIPLLPQMWILPVLCVFQCFSLSSYAVGDASLLERIDPAVRGRFFGLFFTMVGTAGGTAPWVVGFWTDHMGENAMRPMPYLVPFSVLGAMMLSSAGSIQLIKRLGQADSTHLEPSAPLEMAAA
jgi:MFS family permease